MAWREGVPWHPCGLNRQWQPGCGCGVVRPMSGLAAPAVLPPPLSVSEMGQGCGGGGRFAEKTGCPPGAVTPPLGPSPQIIGPQKMGILDFTEMARHLQLSAGVQICRSAIVACNPPNGVIRVDKMLCSGFVGFVMQLSNCGNRTGEGCLLEWWSVLTGV